MYINGNIFQKFIYCLTSWPMLPPGTSESARTVTKRACLLALSSAVYRLGPKEEEVKGGRCLFVCAPSFGGGLIDRENSGAP